MGIHPITLAVVKGALQQVCNEIDVVHIHSAFSQVIAEQGDVASGIYEWESGEVVAQSETGLPIFIFTMQAAVQSVIRELLQEGGVDDINHGDIWVVNEPHRAGSHLNDLRMAMAYFYKGKPFGWLANTGHYMDIGGSVPGGWRADATEIFQEGLRLPVIKLFDQGRLNKEVLKLVMANTRLPDLNRADISAQIDALKVGAKRLTEVLDKFGADTVMGCVEELKEHSEAGMRSHIANMPDGVYRFTDHLDNDGITDTPLTVQVTVEIKGSEMHLDFSGSSPQPRGPYNISRSTTISACFIALKHMFPEVPINAGTFRPITFTIPQGSLLSAGPTAATSGWGPVMLTVSNTVFGALSTAIPDKVPAMSFSSPVAIVLGGHDQQGKFYVMLLPTAGGYGGTKESDGLVNGAPIFSMARFPTVEVTEHRFPVLWERYAIREGSGGAGRQRGGCGNIYEFKLLGEEAILSLTGDTNKYKPWGVLGGKEAAGNEFTIFQADGPFVPPLKTKLVGFKLVAGDIVRGECAGGGGYGSPLERDERLVVRDVELGYVDRESARKDYGVVLREGSLEVDRAETIRPRTRS